MKKVFLGGTCNGSKWREALIPMLKIDYFNPVVQVWDDAARAEEERQKKACDFELYVITPWQTGFFSIAEATAAAASRRNSSAMFCVLEHDNGADEFRADQLESLQAVSGLLAGFGAGTYRSLVAVADALNQHYVDIPYSPSLVECCIKRDGPTQIWMSKTEYVFKKNELGSYVCAVHNTEHLAKFLKMPDFRVYQPAKRPHAAFADDEREFMAQWETKSELPFYAYVNANISRFLAAGQKVQAVAIAKWDRFQAPKHPGLRLVCPIKALIESVMAADAAVTVEIGKADAIPAADEPVIQPAVFVSIEATPPADPPAQAPQDPEHATWSDAQWDDWSRSWTRLSGVHFAKLLEAPAIQQMLMDAPDQIYERAEQKWEKLMPGVPFPLVEEE